MLHNASNATRFNCGTAKLNKMVIRLIEIIVTLDIAALINTHVTLVFFY